MTTTKPPVGRRGRQRQRGAPEVTTAVRPSNAARRDSDHRHQRLWNSGEVSSRVIASRREPARRIALAAWPAAAAGRGGVGDRRRVALADAAGEAAGPVDAPQHRLRPRPVGGAVGPAVRRRRVPQRLAEAGQDAGQAGTPVGRHVQRADAWRPHIPAACAAWCRAARRRQLHQRGGSRARGRLRCRAARPRCGGPRPAAGRRRRNAAPASWPGSGGSRDDSARNRSAATPPASPGGKDWPHHRLLARFMAARAEAEARRVRLHLDRPAGQDSCEAVTSAWV